MASVTGLTAEATQAMLDAAVVDGDLASNGALTLTLGDGTVLNAGTVGTGVVGGSFDGSKHLKLTTRAGATIDLGVVPFDPLAAYPVGAVYTSVVNTSPATLFGGTWVRFAAGRVLVGWQSGDADFGTVEGVGGTKTVTLTTAQIPAHIHSINHDHPAVTVTMRWNAVGSTGGSALQVSDIDGQTGATGGTADSFDVNVPNYTGNSGSTGGGDPHNNIQPYIVVYMWKRTA